MEFRLQIHINVPQERVFSFLRDKHLHQRPARSAVRVLEKTTPGEVVIGTRYREVVRMLPWYTGEILSEVTVFQPERCLAETFTGPAMDGELTYHFEPLPGGTLLTQAQQFDFSGWVGWFEPIIRVMLAYQLRKRLRAIKVILESDFLPNP